MYYDAKNSRSFLGFLYVAYLFKSNKLMLTMWLIWMLMKEWPEYLNILFQKY